MAWGAEDDEEDVYGGVAQALADPAGTYADETGSVPSETPKIKDGSPSTVQQDSNKDADQEASYIAGNTGSDAQTAPMQNEIDQVNNSGLPEEGTSHPPQEQMVTTDEPGDDGDQDTAALAGQQQYKAPAPLVYQPYADHSADYAAMTTQKASENPDDFKPSFGRKLAGAISGGLVGFGTRNSGEGLNAARAVTGKPLAQAQQRWKAQEAPLESKIAADKAADQAVDRTNQQNANVYNAAERNMTNQARVDNWNAQAQQRKAAAQAKLNTVDKNTMGPVDPNNPMGEWQGKTPGGQVVRGLEPPAAIQKSPAYQMQQRRNDLKGMTAAGIKLTPQEAKYYVVNGKLTDPTAHTDIHINEKPDGSWAPPGNGGRGAGMTQGKQDQIIHNKNTAMAKAQQQHAAGLMDDDEYQSALQDAQDDFEQRIEHETGQKPEHVTVGKDFQFQSGGNTLPPSNPQQAQQPAQQQAPPPQQQQAAVQNGNGQQLADVNLAKQYLAKAGGNKQMARQLAAKDGWKF